VLEEEVFYIKEKKTTDVKAGIGWCRNSMKG
jgi:hypothetical protein